MRIAFDATGILGPMSRNRGIGNYSMGQFSTMIQCDKENEYFFFNLFDCDFSLKEGSKEIDNLEEFKLYTGKNNFMLGDDCADAIRKIVRKFLKEKQIDVFCITSPFDCLNVKYQAEWFEGVKLVAIVYDIIPFIFKDHYFPEEGSIDWYMKCIEFLREVDRIQVISQSVKDDMIQYLDFPAEKIDVIWGAVDKRYHIAKIAEEEKEALYHKFGINGEFIMCTGGDDERKNIAGLIEAYSRVNPDIRERYQLVIVCKLSPASVERYRNLSWEYGCGEQVVLTNFVSNEELLQFYNLASLMAFPSTYEGFGLPIVEAWACGTSVLTSNNSSLVQIAGDGAVIVDPFDIDDIARGLEYALTECDLKELLEKGREQLKKFQWENVADASISSFNMLKSGEKEEPAKKEERKTIAFFTPLPPLQSGISDYSVDIIMELSTYFDIDVYIDDNYEADVDLGGHVCIQNHKKYKKQHKKYADTIYQIGNSEFHMYMFPYVQKYPGTVVLHDYNMHGVAVHTCFVAADKDYDRFQKILSEDYDEQAVTEYIDKLKNGQSGYRIFDMPLNGFVVNYAKKIIVHSNESKRKLLEKNIGRNVCQIWHYAKVEGKPEENDLIKQKMGYRSSDCILAAFGHVHETKRVIPVLKAFKELIKDNNNLQLLFVGKLSEGLIDEFEEFIKKENLSERVKVTGYIELDAFVDYIDLTDICLNLRYPYNGETSGSLMRIFAKGKCVVVNDIGSFGEFPDDTCIKIPSVEAMDEDMEVEQICNGIRRLLANPEERARISQNAYEFAKENLDIHIVGKKYADFINAKSMERISEEDIAHVSSRLAEMTADQEEINKVSDALVYLM